VPRSEVAGEVWGPYWQALIRLGGWANWDFGDHDLGKAAFFYAGGPEHDIAFDLFMSALDQASSSDAYRQHGRPRSAMPSIGEVFLMGHGRGEPGVVNYDDATSDARIVPDDMLDLSRGTEAGWPTGATVLARWRSLAAALTVFGMKFPGCSGDPRKLVEQAGTVLHTYATLAIERNTTPPSWWQEPSHVLGPQKKGALLSKRWTEWDARRRRRVELGANQVLFPNEVGAMLELLRHEDQYPAQVERVAEAIVRDWYAGYYRFPNAEGVHLWACFQGGQDAYWAWRVVFPPKTEVVGSPYEVWGPFLAKGGAAITPGNIWYYMSGGQMWDHHEEHEPQRGGLPEISPEVGRRK